MNPNLFAEAAATGSTTISVPWLLVLIVAGLYCIKHMNAKAAHAVVFIAIGVVGAATIIGAVTWQGLDWFAGLSH